MLGTVLDKLNIAKLRGCDNYDHPCDGYSYITNEIMSTKHCPEISFIKALTPRMSTKSSQ